MTDRGSSSQGRMLIAGVGNIFLGDDAFGPEVARRLAAEDLPGWVRVADYGISGMHLAYDLADGYETAILIDAAPRGGEPGTVTVLEVEAEHRRDLAAAAGPLGASRLFDSHGMQPDVVLGVLDMLGGGGPARTLVVGCEPAVVDYAMELSEPVAGAVDEAVQVVLGLVAEAGHAPPAAGGSGAAGSVTLPTPVTPAAPVIPAAPVTPAAPVIPAAPGTPAAENPEIPLTTGEGVSHVPWHSR